MCMKDKRVTHETEPIRAWKVVCVEATGNISPPFHHGTLYSEWQQCTGFGLQAGFCAFTTMEQALKYLRAMERYCGIPGERRVRDMPYGHWVVIPVQLKGEITYGTICKVTIGAGMSALRGEWIRI